MTLPEAVVDRYLSRSKSDQHKGDDITPRGCGSHADEVGDRPGPEVVLHQ